MVFVSSTREKEVANEVREAGRRQIMPDLAGLAEGFTAYSKRVGNHWQV